MRWAAFFLLLMAACLHASEPTAVGEWSQAVRGLRGRLLLAEDAPFNGTRMVAVYLELQNVSDVLNALLVDFQPPDVDLVDADGKSIPQSHPPASVMTAWPHTLVLPNDSTLRFRVSVQGYGIPKDGGVALQFDTACWIVPLDGAEEKYLRGSFVASESSRGGTEGQRQDSERGNRAWRGTLHLPRIKVPPSAPARTP